MRELARGRSSLTDDEKNELTSRMRAYLPGGGLEFLVGPGADAVASELAAPHDPTGDAAPTRTSR